MGDESPAMREREPGHPSFFRLYPLLYPPLPVSCHYYLVTRTSSPPKETRMALKRPQGPTGTLVVLEHTSKILKDNPLGDPPVRKLGVWLPPQYDEGRGRRRFPVLYDLVGFTGSGLAHANWKPFGDNVPERAARPIRGQKMGAPLTRETIPFVDREFRTAAGREHRGCFGKSSGGYGAIIHGMKYAKYWGAVADHSGDACFDFVYWHDWPNKLDTLAKHRVPKRKPGRFDVRRASRYRGAAAGFGDGRG